MRHLFLEVLGCTGRLLLVAQGFSSRFQGGSPLLKEHARCRALGVPLAELPNLTFRRLTRGVAASFPHDIVPGVFRQNPARYCWLHVFEARYQISIPLFLRVLDL